MPIFRRSSREAIISTQNQTPYLTVVIPAYNEAIRLPTTLQQVVSYLETRSFTAEVLVVDDGSSDNTVALAENIAGEHPIVRIIKNDHRGKGYTVRTGMLAGRGKFILFSDADLAVPIAETAKLLSHLENGYDVVIGSREGQGAERIDEPWRRHFMGRVFNSLIHLIALRGFQDTQCGFKAFSRPVAQNLFNRVQLYGENATVLTEAAVTGFDVEILFLAVKFGYRVKEVPVKWIYGEETKVNPLKDSWRNLKDVIAVRWNDITGKYTN